MNEAGFEYAKAESLGHKYYEVLLQSYQNGLRSFPNKQSLIAYFNLHDFTAVHAVKIMTQALLIGSLIEHGFDSNTLIHSDGAGQFNVFVHSLCWKHAERPLVKLIACRPTQQKELDDKRAAFWSIYQDLKKYKQKPEPQQALLIDQKFDQLCEEVIHFDSLNKLLKALKNKKDKLLLVLTQLQTSLHNNDSERDIREYVKRRKISAGTRSEKGKKARDTLLSLKKTCQKLGISFWDYLIDRLQNKNEIDPLSLIMERMSTQAKA